MPCLPPRPSLHQRDNGKTRSAPAPCDYRPRRALPARAVRAVRRCVRIVRARAPTTGGCLAGFGLPQVGESVTLSVPVPGGSRERPPRSRRRWRPVVARHGREGRHARGRRVGDESTGRWGRRWRKRESATTPRPGSLVGRPNPGGVFRAKEQASGK
jgi:hypothetical protein